MTIKKNTVLLILSITLFITAVTYFIYNNDEYYLSNKATNEKSVHNVDNNDKNDVSNKDTKSNTVDNSVTKDQEKEIINYFLELEQDTINSTKESKLEKIKDKLDYTFFTSADFIFYNKSIKGVTFNDLTNKTKVQILKTAYNIDSLIVNKFPNYKDNFRTTGKNAYNYINTGIDNLQNKIRYEVGEEKYINFYNNVDNSKNKITDIKDKVVGSIKNWYENKRGE